MQGGMIVDSVSPHMRRPMGSNHQMCIPQHFPPRGPQMQQHNIMGQPFIELRHRAPENRVRIPFGPHNVLDHTNHSHRPPNGFMGGQNIAFPGNQVPRMMDPMFGHSQQGSISHLQTPTNSENRRPLINTSAITTQLQIPLAAQLSHSASNGLVTPSQLQLSGPSEEISLSCSDGIEGKLDPDDSAVKDLDDVEVKDLVDEDLDNLNLDADDGKDIDLETNDLHLDDLLESGFDLIAYADPELNLEDKKDMFNEELDLSDSIDDHGETSDLQKSLSVKRSAGCGNVSSAQPQSEDEHSIIVKLEKNLSNEGNPQPDRMVKTEVHQALISNQEASLMGNSVDEHQPMSSKGGQDNVSNRFDESCAGAHPGSALVLSNIKEKHEDPTLQTNLGPSVQTNMGLVMLQGQSQDLVHRVDPSVTQAALFGNPTMKQSGNQQMPLQGFGSSQGQQVDLNLPMFSGSHPVNPTQQGMFTSGAAGTQASQEQQNQLNRPLLLDEQPLLLQDLLDQERQEQQQQRQMQAMICQRSNDPFFPNSGKPKLECFDVEFQ